jgi:hypothetical protein
VRLLILFGLLFAGLVLMFFKTEGWLVAPHPVFVVIDVVCLGLALGGLIATGRHVLQQHEPVPAGAHARRPPVQDEPLP